MLRQKLMSRKFWVAVATAFFIVLTEGLGYNVDKNLYWQIVTLAVGYIFGEAAVDIAKTKNTTTYTSTTSSSSTIDLSNNPNTPN